MEALKGRRSRLRPFRAFLIVNPEPWACALDYPAGPLWGPYLSAIRDSHHNPKTLKSRWRPLISMSLGIVVAVPDFLKRDIVRAVYFPKSDKTALWPTLNASGTPQAFFTLFSGSM